MLRKTVEIVAELNTDDVIQEIYGLGPLDLCWVLGSAADRLDSEELRKIARFSTAGFAGFAAKIGAFADRVNRVNSQVKTTESSDAPSHDTTRT